METVKIWEERIVIPTYEVGSPDKNPLFLEKRVYQGSSGKIYPYPSIQEISREKTDHAWNAVWLENEYLRVMILPELGGRIQRAYDKTNDYDFVYYNHVIKPALVGLTGPWISGGIEFNWPQHHRPTTYSPVDYEIRENADGSKSLLIHDVDQMYGTKEITRFTLYPDRAYIEIRGQLYNRTPLPQTFLWWANPAVSVNDNTQSIFPPDVHSVYDHGKRAVSRFPIATGEYYKHDYSEGVDISRYKNIPVPTSYMAEKSEYNFVGGYDYGKEAGLLHVADHHVSPGKKQWTWGCGDFGKAWDRNLTDEDGPYIELMTGMYCDNQPDFSWLKPYEEKVFHQYFMPYKAVGQVKNASIHAVLGMEAEEDGLHICVYGTKTYESADIVVTDDGREVYRESTKLSPVDIYRKVLPLEITDPCKVKVAVFAEGRELVSYQPKDQGIPELAEPAKAPAAPEEMLTKEELFRLMKGTIIVSCQATPGEPLYDPERSVMPLMARAAKLAGAKMIRTSSVRDIIGIKEETGLPIVSEIMDASQLPLFDNVDVLQVGARNMQNFSLLKALGQTRKPILLKRGLCATYEEWLMSAEYILAGGNPNVILCERGIRTYETYTRNTLDIACVPVLRQLTHLPIVLDPSHAAGKASLIPDMACAAIAAGADGLEIEVHHDPAHARSDGPQALVPEVFDKLMRKLTYIKDAVDRADREIR